MSTLQKSLTQPFHTGIFTQNPLLRFGNWCTGQQKNNFTWMAVALTAHGCIITPLTLFFVMVAGNNFVFWPIVMSAMSMTMVTNLAALPTRITIPVFFLGIIIDLVIIINCIAILFAG